MQATWPRSLTMHAPFKPSNNSQQNSARVQIQACRPNVLQMAWENMPIGFLFCLCADVISTLKHIGQSVSRYSGLAYCKHDVLFASCPVSWSSIQQYVLCFRQYFVSIQTLTNNSRRTCTMPSSFMLIVSYCPNFPIPMCPNYDEIKTLSCFVNKFDLNVCRTINLLQRGVTKI